MEDGSEYAGSAFGARQCADGSGEGILRLGRVLEIVFNTSMAGYQEILSDPSYTDQAIIMTYPLIGNYGMAEGDYETLVPTAGAMIVRDYHDTPSNFRSTRTLSEVMEQFGIPGVSGVDTRMLTRWVRDHGSCRVLITDDPALPAKDAAEQMRRLSLPKDAVSRVSCREARLFRPGTMQDTAGADPASANSAGADPAGSIPASADLAGESILRGLGQGEVIDNLHAAADMAQRPLVAAIDCGMKRNIVRSFLARGVSVAVLPWNVTAEEIRALRPDGVFLSNGPGDPQDVPETVQTVREIMGDVPLFGICLGHQIIALAAGARTYKLKFGHRGGNHPVRELATGRIEITSQNHSYAVDRASLAGTGLEVTHVNLLDDTVEGLACPDRQVFSVQYHPESAPGPQDSGYLFDRFVHMIAGS